MCMWFSFLSTYTPYSLVLRSFIFLEHRHFGHFLSIPAYDKTYSLPNSLEAQVILRGSEALGYGHVTFKKAGEAGSTEEGEIQG